MRSYAMLLKVMLDDILLLNLGHDLLSMEIIHLPARPSPKPNTATHTATQSHSHTHISHGMGFRYFSLLHCDWLNLIIVDFIVIIAAQASH